MPARAEADPGLMEDRARRKWHRSGTSETPRSAEPSPAALRLQNFLTESVPDGHSTEKNLQMHPNKMRRKIKGFGGETLSRFWLQSMQTNNNKAAPERGAAFV